MRRLAAGGLVFLEVTRRTGDVCAAIPGFYERGK